MSGKTIIGSLLVLFGGLLILDNFDVVNFDTGDVFKFLWPSLLIIWGIQAFSNNHSRVWGSILLAFGAVSMLDAFEVISINLWSLIWPLLIIGIGLSVILPKKYKNPDNISEKNSINRSAFFSGVETKIKNDDFKGGEITTVFGGAEIDLTNAKIKDEAVLNVTAVFGGAEIKVPKDWKVEFSGTPVLGGFSDKTEPSSKASKLLKINGVVVFGGVEIKN